MSKRVTDVCEVGKRCLSLYDDYLAVFSAKHRGKYGLGDVSRVSEIIKREKEKLASGVQRGFCLTDDGNPQGILTYEMTSAACFVTMIHLLRPYATRENLSALMETLLQNVRGKARTVRVPAGRPICVSERSARSLFRSLGFVEYVRARMLLDLRRFRSASVSLEPITLSKVDLSKQDELAELARRCYEGSPDERVMFDPTPEEYKRMYSRLFGGAFGKFDQENSFVLADGEKLIGALYTLVSSIGDDVALLGDISLLPEYRGKGYGAKLMTLILTRYKGAGYKKCELAVTLENRTAFNLYKKMGFRVTEKGSVFVKEV